jgi:hypothetical protein
LFAVAVTGITRSLQTSSGFEGHVMLVGTETANPEKPRAKRSCLLFMVQYLQLKDDDCLEE